MLKSVVNLVLKLGALQLFFCGLQSGGNLVIFEDIFFDQFLLLRSMAKGLVQLIDRIRVKS